MKKTLTILIILIVMAGAVGAIVWAGRDQKPESGQAQASATITYTSSGFSPSEVTVAKGGSVTFKNKSDAKIEPSSDPHPTHSNNPELNAGDIEPGESKTLTVNTTGEWGFHNHYNTAHKATVTVQ